MRGIPQETKPPELKVLQHCAQIPRRSADERRQLKQHLPELLQLESLLRKHQQALHISIEDHIEWQSHQLPYYCITLGRQECNLPLLILVAGVHGIERIGTQVLLAWLRSVLVRLQWDPRLQHLLQQLQVVLVPIANPAGMYANQRANGNGVDLNRNAPIDAEDKVPWLCGGQRLSNKLPWYRGRAGNSMEKEVQLLERIVERHLASRPLSLVLDLHSGFGTRDRLWFPFAYSKKPIGNRAEYMALKLLWERSYPHHNYVFEPQSRHYLSHGDIWDYLYLQNKAQGDKLFLPLTLEMGSWAWVKKRPRQLFNLSGLFHPQVGHRHERVLRRHLTLMDFLLSATVACEHWLPKGDNKKLLKQAAKDLWR